jgi:hypothetical protein
MLKVIDIVLVQNWCDFFMVDDKLFVCFKYIPI